MLHGRSLLLVVFFLHSVLAVTFIPESKFRKQFNQQQATASQWRNLGKFALRKSNIAQPWQHQGPVKAIHTPKPRTTANAHSSAAKQRAPPAPLDPLSFLNGHHDFIRNLAAQKAALNSGVPSAKPGKATPQAAPRNPMGKPPASPVRAKPYLVDSTTYRKEHPWKQPVLRRGWGAGDSMEFRVDDQGLLENLKEQQLYAQPVPPPAAELKQQVAIPQSSAHPPKLGGPNPRERRRQKIVAEKQLSTNPVLPDRKILNKLPVAPRSVQK